MLEEKQVKNELTEEELKRFDLNAKLTVYREAKITVEKRADHDEDEDEQRVEVVFATEEALIERFDMDEGVFVERLGMDDGEVNLEFIGSGRAPLLLDHNRERQIGVVESVAVEDGIARALVKVSRSVEGKEIFNDIKDGIRANLSVGYFINERVFEGRDEDDHPILRAVDWTPFEVSLVSVPADTRTVVETVRSKAKVEEKTEEDNSASDNNNIGVRQMSEENDKTENVDVEAIKANAREEARARQLEFDAIGEKFDQKELVAKSLARGDDIDVCRKLVMENMTFKSDNPETTIERDTGLGLSNREVKQFSLRRAILAGSHPELTGGKEYGFEREVLAASRDHYRKSTGKEAKGFVIPVDALTRDLTAGSAETDTSALVGEDHLGGSFIEALRNNSVLMGLGVTVLPNLSGDVSIPKQTGTSAGVWIDPENAGSSDQDANVTFGNVVLSPRTVGANVGYSRQLLLQSDPSIDALIRDDLASAIALAIDLAGFTGSGASGVPQGILGIADVSSVPFVFDAGPTHADVVNLESLVASANVRGTATYVTNPTIRGRMKVTTIDAGSGLFVWDAANTVNGLPAVATTQVTVDTHNVFYGVFAQFLIGMWGGLDIISDPFTDAIQGSIRLTALQSVDMAARHDEAFAVIAEALS